MRPFYLPAIKVLPPVIFFAVACLNTNRMGEKAIWLYYQAGGLFLGLFLFALGSLIGNKFGNGIQALGLVFLWITGTPILIYLVFFVNSFHG